jgi:hypothetical protein
MKSASTVTPANYAAALRGLETNYAAACEHFARLTT